mmetsp:Transcript_20793/g.43577  ORF Transcript_20793/g.43577 Transcript_20793/m.43577 type:complete len:133 (+) Transcript_20793:419-817(+)
MDDRGIVHLLFSVATAAIRGGGRGGQQDGRRRSKHEQHTTSNEFGCPGMDEGLQVSPDGSKVVGCLCCETRRSMNERPSSAIISAKRLKVIAMITIVDYRTASSAMASRATITNKAFDACYSINTTNVTIVR